MDRVAGDVTKLRSRRSVRPNREQLEVPTDLLREHDPPIPPRCGRTRSGHREACEHCDHRPHNRDGEDTRQLAHLCPLGLTEWRSYECHERPSHHRALSARGRAPSADARLGRSSAARRAAGPYAAALLRQGTAAAGGLGSDAAASNEAASGILGGRCRRRTWRSSERGVEAYDLRDIDALLEDLDPDVEWQPVLQVLLGGGDRVPGTPGRS